MEEENASHEKRRVLVAARKAEDTDKLMISKMQTLMLVITMLINGINMVKRNGFISIEYVDLSVKPSLQGHKAT